MSLARAAFASWSAAALPLLASLVAAPAAAQGGPFLDQLQAHCGKAYEGRIIDPAPADSVFANNRLVMHVRECTPEAVRVPFHVGDDHSRTWVFTPTTAGVRLKHDHRHADGTEDRVTQYGGDAATTGADGVLEFPADSFTVALLPAARTNVWTVELTPTRFAYQLRRTGSSRRVRVEFDLTQAVAPPPAPWGAQ